LPQSENAKLVLDAKMMNLQVKEQEDPKVLENVLNKLKKEYALCNLPFPEQQLVTILKSQLMRMKGVPYGTTLKEAKSSKKLSVNEAYLYALADAQAMLSGGTAGPVVLPSRPTGMQLEVTSDDIIIQMKCDFEKASVLEPSKFKLLGSTATSKATTKPKDEVTLVETERQAVPYNCSKCGQPGHKGKDCPNKGNNSNNNKFTYGGRGNGVGRGQGGRGGAGRGRGAGKPKFNGNCNKCGKFGHMAKDCWAKDGEVANVEVVLAAIDSEDIYNWMAEDKFRLSINEDEEDDAMHNDDVAPVVFMNEGTLQAHLMLQDATEALKTQEGIVLEDSGVLLDDLESAIYTLRHMEHGLCLVCL
jgi:ribosomal protein L15